ncbi:hypothetical protein [Paracoccus shanxieyensis]|nr:hypothetical protein [Paracoccus shanxieyensis]
MIAGPVASLLPVVPALTNTETPVMALFREWKVAFDRVEDLVTDGWPQARINAEVDGINRILDRMIGAPSRDGRDVCAKLTAFTCDGECFLDDDGRLSRLILADARSVSNSGCVIDGGKG